MAASIEDATTLIDTLVSLQPRVAAAADSEDAEDPMAAQCAELLAQCPEMFSMRTVKEV